MVSHPKTTSSINLIPSLQNHATIKPPLRIEHGCKRVIGGGSLGASQNNLSEGLGEYRVAGIQGKKKALISTLVRCWWYIALDRCQVVAHGFEAGNCYGHHSNDGNAGVTHRVSCFCLKNPKGSCEPKRGRHMSPNPH